MYFTNKPEDQRSCNAHMRPKPELSNFQVLFPESKSDLSFLPFSSREKLLEDLTIYGHDGHPGHVTYNIWTNYIPPPPPPPDHKGSTQIFTFMCQAAWEQIFESIYLSDLGQRSNNYLDHWYSYVFMSHLDNNWYQLSVQRLQYM